MVPLVWIKQQTWVTHISVEFIKAWTKYLVSEFTYKNESRGQAEVEESWRQVRIKTQESRRLWLFFIFVSYIFGKVLSFYVHVMNNFGILTKHCFYTCKFDKANEWELI